MKKRISALLIAALMLLSLCACGAENPKESKPHDKDPEHPEFLYAADFYPLETAAKYGLSPLAYYNGGIYCSAQEKVGPLPHLFLS